MPFPYTFPFYFDAPPPPSGGIPRYLIPLVVKRPFRRQTTVTAGLAFKAATHAAFPLGAPVQGRAAVRNPLAVSFSTPVLCPIEEGLHRLLLFFMTDMLDDED